VNDWIVAAAVGIPIAVVLLLVGAPVWLGFALLGGALVFKGDR
jgi:hypothetical protein